VIDSHCHLADEAFAGDVEAVIGRARAAGVERALVTLEAGSLAEAKRAEHVEEIWPEVRVAIGVHPHVAQLFSDEPSRAASVVRAQVGVTPSARAVGEIGLDYHYHQGEKTLAAQRAVFRAQLRLARELKLPVAIHSREADQDTLAILRQEGQGAITGVLHCFTGTAALASGMLDLGFYISIAGVVTFPRASDVRSVVRTIPFDRLLIETDSPFLAPVPHRGRRNEPAYVDRVVATLADLYGVPAHEVVTRTTENFHALFRP
jgi:TatD DNase family protein